MGMTPDKAPKEIRIFEMRTYTAAPGKLDELLARFRNLTCKFFEKHGMTNVGYFVPVDNKESKLIYFLAFPTSEAREKSFSELGKDEEFTVPFKATETSGTLVSKVESVFLTATDYSKVYKRMVSKEPALFELRTYHCHPDKLANLNSRFRDHTTKLFEKHGIKNVLYWVPMDKDKGADNTMIYIIAHKDKDAAKKSWSEFVADPDWIAARDESEKDGKIVMKVESVYMIGTDFSNIK